MRISPCATLLAAACLAPVGLAQNLLVEPSFEGSSPGMAPAGWNSFGNGGGAQPPTNVVAEVVNPPEFVPRTGAFLVKMFGTFGGGFNVSGMFQCVPANPGDVFTMDCYSRHSSLDPMIGGGAPNSNWMVMKIAFFDVNRVEIGAAEGTILDGTSPQDTWIDNAPITGTAPPGTVRAEAFILFLQPGLDGGAGQVDDVELTLGSPTPAAYPGTGEDVQLSSAFGGAPLSAGGGNDVKVIPPAGGLLELNVSSPAGGFNLTPILLMAQPFPTGNPPTPFFLFPELWFDFAQPLILLTNPTASPIGPSIIGPNGGTSSFYNVPAGLTGTSLMVQAIVVDDILPANNFYAASDAHELQFQ